MHSSSVSDTVAAGHTPDVDERYDFPDKAHGTTFDRPG